MADATPTVCRLRERVVTPHAETFADPCRVPLLLAEPVALEAGDGTGRLVEREAW